MIASQRRSRDLRHLAAVFVGLALMMAAAGYYYYRASMTSQRQATEEALNSIADLKANELSSWLNAHAARTYVTRHNPLLLEPLRRVLAGTAGAADRAGLAVWLSDLSAYSYADALIVAADGRVAMAASGTRPQFDTFVMRALAGITPDSTPAFIDLHRDARDRTVYMDLPIPLTVADGSRVLAGYLILRLDPRRNLFPLIQKWPTPSRTAETLLVRREGDEVVYLNELRHRQGTTLTLRMTLVDPDLPAARALRGDSGIVYGVDYRGVPVVAALRAVAGTSWHIVAKIDETEAYAPLQRLGSIMLIWVGTAVLLFGLIAGFLWDRAGQQMMRASEEKYRGAFQNCPIGIMLINPRGEVMACNRYVAEMFGTRAEDYIGMNLLDRLPDGPIRQTLVMAVADDQVHRYEGRHTSVVNGRSLWISVSSEQATPGTITTIIEDISGRKQAEEEMRRMNASLQQANAELRSLDQLKGNLIANVSHELRTPLVAVRGYTEMMLQNEAGTLTPKQCDALRIMLRNIDRLTSLFDNLLEFSNGERDYRRVGTSCLLAGLLQDVGETMQARTWQQNVTLTIMPVDPGLAVQADPQKLRQALLNLTDNGLKFTPAGGTVTLAATGEPDTVRISVADTGIGISADDQPRIFDRFYQVDTSLTRPYSGIGLGLSIVKDIITRHGGTITVNSRPGQGTEFVITLPRQT